MKQVEVIQVIKTTLRCIGDGTEQAPLRTVTQYWDMDGALLWEHDPCAVGDYPTDGKEK